MLFYEVVAALTRAHQNERRQAGLPTLVNHVAKTPKYDLENWSRKCRIIRLGDSGLSQRILEDQEVAHGCGDPRGPDVEMAMSSEP